jgi:hypothetical protein
MRVWIACFFVLFALAEFFDWIKEVNLPLPIYILGGAFLAVASNYDKVVGAYFPEFSQTNAQIITDKIITDQIITDKNQLSVLEANSTPLSLDSSVESSTEIEKKSTTNLEVRDDISETK